MQDIFTLEKSKTKKVTPYIEEKYEICEKGHSLL